MNHGQSVKQQPQQKLKTKMIEMNREKRKVKSKIKSAIRAARHSFSAVVCVGAVILTSSSAQAQNPEILANNVGNPGNIIIDESSVYWGDALTGIISSVSKNPGGAVTNYPVPMVAGGDLAQDNVFLYFVGAASVGPFVGEHDVFKTPKFGGFTNPINSGVDPGWALGGTLTIGPAGGILYYMGGWRLPAVDFPSLYSPLVTLSTQGGNDNALIYNNPLGTDEALFQQHNLRYWVGGNPNNFSTDSTFLNWSDADGTSIWQMPLIGGSATAIVSGRSNINVIATPTTGEAAGSIFWVEGTISNASLMRREVGGQIITVLNGITNAGNRCFAVDDDKVFCEQGDGLVQVSIDGGAPRILADVGQAFGPVGVAVDSNFVYWSNLIGQIMRIARPAGGHPAFFNGEIALGGGWFYLQFANGAPFGYYSYLSDQNFIYHIDLGFEYLIDANDANHGIYFYDFASSSFFYTSPTLFPDLYDFSLNAWLYYLPDANNPGRYTHNPRWFYNFATGQWITL
jgi:hypothetical protein